MVGLARWVTAAVYDEARAKAQAARAARLARSGVLDQVLAVWTWPLPRPVASVVIKDVKGFLRDPAQWSQLFVVAAIVAIAIASAAAMPTDFLNGPIGVYLREVLSFGALTMVGFIMASLAARFQFTAVSLEGRAFWIVRTAPLRPEQLLLAKLWPGLLPMVVIGEVLALGIGQILGAGPVVMGVSAFSALAMSLGIAGLAVGMGALYPDFKADNAARVAASPPAMLFMLAAMGLVFAVAALEVIPVAVSMSLRFNEREPRVLDWVGLLAPHLGVAALCGAALLLPMRLAAGRLWRRELPNS
jgi:ABC-2 type transport system permease protein